MPTVQVSDGLELYYELQGQGDPLVVLGGIMMSTASWAMYVPHLAPHARVILVDLRDQGRSTRVDRDYSIEVHVDDVCTLLDNLGLSKVHLFGVSYGGSVALLFALRYPERVQTLILANTFHWIPNHLRAIGRAWEVAAELNNPARFFELAIPYIYSSTFYRTHQEFLKQRQKMFTSMLTPEWFAGFRRLCRSALDLAVSPEQLQKLAMPILLIGAEEDHVTPLPFMMEMYHLLPKAEFLVIPRAGHGAVVERPQEFLTAIVGFIHRHGTTSDPTVSPGGKEVRAERAQGTKE